MKQNKKEKKLFNQKMTKGEKVAFISNIVLLAMLLVSFVYALIMCFIAPISSSTEITKSNYMLTAFQSVLGITVLLLPYLFSKKFYLDIPAVLKIILVVYVYAAIFLGEVQSFYYRFEHWDTICHLCSGMIFTVLSFSFIYLMNTNKTVHLSLNPGFIAFFSFCFAVTSGVVWELLEFGIDTVFGVNMQKFIPEISGLFNGGASKEPLTGTDEQIAQFFRSPAGYKYALMDTMYDLIVDCLGSLIMSVVGYIALKFKKDALDSYVIKRRKVDVLEKEEAVIQNICRANCVENEEENEVADSAENSEEEENQDFSLDKSQQ